MTKKIEIYGLHVFFWISQAVRSLSPACNFCSQYRHPRTVVAMANQVSTFTVGGTWLSADQKAALEETAASVATPGKGITACDESPGTIGGRFEKVGIKNTEENRRRYRQMLFETPGCENYLSAAILDPEVSCDTVLVR
jgi:hypothetical protein